MPKTSRRLFESADNSNDAITKLLDILVAEDDYEKICSAFNCTRQERAPEPCMILDEIESNIGKLLVNGYLACTFLKIWFCVCYQ